MNKPRYRYLETTLTTYDNGEHETRTIRGTTEIDLADKRLHRALEMFFDAVEPVGFEEDTVGQAWEAIGRIVRVAQA